MGEQMMMAVEYVKARNRQKANRHYRKHAAAIRGRAAAWKKANPDKVKASFETYRRKNATKLIARRKAAYRANPEHMRAKTREYRERYPERVRESRCRSEENNREHLRSLRAQWKIDHAEHIRQQSVEWRALHRDRLEVYNREWARANPTSRRATYTRYRKANPEKVNLQNRHRLDRLAGLESTLTIAEWKAILRDHGHACCYCGNGDVTLAMEHLVPVLLCGSTTMANIAPACKSCNSAKGAKTTSEFLWWRAKQGDHRACRMRIGA